MPEKIFRFAHWGRVFIPVIASLTSNIPYKEVLRDKLIQAINVLDPDSITYFSSVQADIQSSKSATKGSSK
jgi:hypothetical protein